MNIIENLNNIIRVEVVGGQPVMHLTNGNRYIATTASFHALLGVIENYINSSEATKAQYHFIGFPSVVFFLNEDTVKFYKGNAKIILEELKKAKQDTHPRTVDKSAPFIYIY